LALGIGMTTAVFSIVNSVLLRPLTYRDPQRLYVVRETVTALAATYPPLPGPLPHYFEWQRDMPAFASLAIARPIAMMLTGPDEVEQVSGAMVSAHLFETLGVPPALGGGFRPEEDGPGRDGEIVLSDASWRIRFHADPAIVGRAVVLDGTHYIV